MKKILFCLFVALIATTSIQAQQISVVSPGGATTLYRTLPLAIDGAEPGSVIYLPGGGYPISDDVKITKKLTIIGIGHYVKGNNVDGVTTITGNLWFNEGSSGSAVMACYITGNVNIGDGGASVNDVLIRYCNLNSVQVKNSTCLGTTVNQNYIRNISEFGGSNPIITNNVLYTIGGVSGGIITHNIVTNNYYLHVIAVSNSTISYNVFFRCVGGATNNGFCNGGGNQGTDNMYPNAYNNYAQFDNRIILNEGVSWNDVFVNNAGITPNSDFTFTDAYKQYQGKIGISGGTGFNKQQMAPVPYIVAKDIKQQTDSSGKLNVKIRVKANQ